MIKKRIRYQGTDGMVEEDFYFHLSKVDLLAMEAKHEKTGGIKGYYERVIASGDSEQILDLVKWFIVSSYGERTEQGRHLKNERLREEFVGGDAFSELFLELGQDAEKAAQFINGLVPADLAAEVAKMTAQQERAPDAPMMGPRPAVSGNVFERDEPGTPPTESLMQPPAEALSDQPAARVLSASEIDKMDPVDLQRGLVEGRYKLS